jgi:hypothetical protein
MTDAEHRAMELTAGLWNHLVSEVVADGPSAAGDLRELVVHIHGIQHAIMSQAAARAYPDRYRLLGGTLARPAGSP